MENTRKTTTFWVLFLWLGVLGHSMVTHGGPQRSLRSSSCVVKANGEHWKRVWSQSFGENFDLNQWTVGHETTLCSGNQVEDYSCNIRENVFTQNGNLVLVAKHPLTPYYTSQYTGARVTSPNLLSSASSANILVEIRAAFPLGTQLYASVFALDESNSAQVATNAQRPYIKRGHCQGQGQVQRDISRSSILPATNLHHFQTYGIQVNRSQVLFNRSAAQRITGCTGIPGDPFETSLRLQFLIGVGGHHFAQHPMPSDYSSLKWLCPALIIDSISVYEQTDNLTLPECSPEELDETGVQEKMAKICATALGGSLDAEEEEHDDLIEISLSLIIFSAVVLPLILLGIVYILFRNSRFKSRGYAGRSTARSNRQFQLGFNRASNDRGIPGKSSFDSRAT